MAFLTLSPGAPLGPHEIIAKLGEGGMGEVYRARDPRLDRQVAIKLLPAATAADPRSRARLRREALAAAALDHPYICKIFEIGEDGGTLFLVMEYVAGDTLHQRLQEGRLPLADSLRVAGEIAEALQQAHAGRFLHRDLKPANIMLTRQGHVKVMDFGLAKRVEDLPAPDEATRELGPQLTAHGAIVGTPDYMSPEQVKGLPLDARSDLFSFGVILAEMISGRHPFRKPSIAETLAAVLHEPPALNGDIPPGVSSVVRRLLEKSPDARYASAVEVQAALMRLNASPSASLGTPAGFRPSAVRKPATWAALAIVLAVLGYLAMNARGPQQPAPANAALAIRSIAVLPLDNYSGDPIRNISLKG